MMLRIVRFLSVVCLCFTAYAFGADSVAVDTAIMPTMTPDTIDVGTFYNGTEVQVTANIPECDGAVLVLEAGRDEIKLNRKGRVAGIWLNVARVTVRNVPKVYILAASDSLDRICPPHVRRRANFGTEYLRDQIQFASDMPLTGNEFDEFLKLKTRNGTYKMDIGIDLTAAQPGRMKLSATLPIAPTIPPGTYKILLYCFKDGNQIGRGESELTVKRIGLARVMANLAHDHAAEYGLLAIAVAMMVGIVMGVIFDSLPGSGH
jgi:uncharacterized protein (TIGR02186 family)